MALALAAPALDFCASSSAFLIFFKLGAAVDKLDVNRGVKCRHSSSITFCRIRLLFWQMLVPSPKVLDS